LFAYILTYGQVYEIIGFMKNPTDKPHFYFIDEAGDPVFYNAKGEMIVGTEGCSKVLIIGYVRTADPEPIRKALEKVRREIKNDQYLKSVPSIQKSLQYFHAKDDCPEVREKVYKAIRNLKFKSEFIVARKDEQRFRKIHLGKEGVFYNDLVTRLFESRMHIAQVTKIYYAIRGNKVRQAPLSDAIQASKLSFESRHETKVNTLVDVLPQAMTGEPCLQVADYMLWALQRAYNRGDVRYLDFVKPRVAFIWDTYDTRTPKKLNRYHSRNKFDINKISPL
jgi:hypothetical protein